MAEFVIEASFEPTSTGDAGDEAAEE
jgi:hypothetical protein